MRKVVIYLLFTFGGLAALTYEVVWMRSFRLVFGSSTESAAAVLAAYFGGMALGNLIGARLSRRSSPLRLYGLAELGIAATALAVGPWLAVFRQVYPTLYPWAADRPALWLTLKLLLALAALAPPTIAMGLTLPLVVRSVVGCSEQLARTSSLLYALNVLGATAGAALAGFVLPMSLGMAGAVYAAAAVNTLIGLAAITLSLGVVAAAPEGPEAPPTLDPAPSAAPGNVRAWIPIALVAVLSGFGTLALEVLYVRILGFRTDGSVYTFSLMLVIFLLCLALGAAATAKWGDRSNLWRLLAYSQAAAMVGILLAPNLFDVGSAVALLTGSESYSVQLWKFALISLATLGLPVVLAGMVLPATWKLATADASAVGHTVGRLVAWNTLAAVAGSLLTGFVLLPRLGLGGSLLAVAALYALVAMIGFWRGFGGLGRALGCAACLSVLAAWYAGGMWHFEAVALAQGERLVRSRDGAAASVAVVEQASGQRILRMNGNYTLGTSAGAARELRQGRLPLILHPNPKRVAFLGVATGMTASAIKDFPIERAVAVELVSEVAEALADFKKWNRAFYEDQRVELVVEDGRNYLLGTGERFDVITSDLFVPWHAGTGDLYTVEHFHRAAARLAEGGIFAQWLPGYQLTEDEIRSITASLQEAFGAVTLWRDDFDLERPLICLVCYRDRARIDGASLGRACRRLAEGGGPAAPYLSSPLGVCMLYVAGDEALRRWAAGAVLNTDDHPYIEFTTPGSFHRHRQKDVGPINRMLSGFRPRKWEYPQGALGATSMDVALGAGDLMHDVQVARQANHFDQEYRYLMELIPLAAEVPAVAEQALRAAIRFRNRNMVARGDDLLLALTAQPQAPVMAIVALADLRRSDGKLQDAIDLMTRVIERVPEALAVRQSLVDLLKQSGQHALMESHLQYILEARPDEPYLRLDLAQAFDRQGKTKEAKEQIERFRQLRLGDDRSKAWRYLRSLELGKYVDEVETDERPGTPAPEPGQKAPSGQP